MHLSLCDPVSLYVHLSVANFLFVPDLTLCLWVCLSLSLILSIFNFLSIPDLTFYVSGCLSL